MTEARRTTSEEARRVGDEIGVDWSRFELEQFRLGMDVEFEHGSHDPQTDVTGDDPILTGKIALAHMKEFPDYYDSAGTHGGRGRAGLEHTKLLTADAADGWRAIMRSSHGSWSPLKGMGGRRSRTSSYLVSQTWANRSRRSSGPWS